MSPCARRLSPWALLSLLLLAPACRSTKAAQVAPRPTGVPTISCRPDQPIATSAVDTRTRYCVVDVGSRNVKLVVASVESTDRPSMRDDRQCYARMQLGDRIVEPSSRMPGVLGDGDVDALVQIINQYSKICQGSGGKMLGAIATEWARQVKNPDQIQAKIKARTGIAMEILAREREGQIGYMAATRGATGKIVLDVGSRSVQISYWPRGDAAPSAVSIPLGIDEASNRFFTSPDFPTYVAAKTAFFDEISPALGPTLVRIQEELTHGTLNREMFSLGENGDVVAALRGQLWDARTRKGVDEATYSALVKYFTPTRTGTHGLVTAFVTASDFSGLSRMMESDQRLVDELKLEENRRIYGAKMLVVPALVSMLTRSLSIDTIVLVPQELPDGLVVEGLK